MSLPSSITPSVSPDAIRRVGKFFDGGPAAVLAETLQNARRARATRVEIDLLDLAGHPTLAIRDDGIGIDDPATLLTLGRSDWEERIADGEDPAGMGVFCLAGLRVEYRSYSASAGHGWRVVIDPDRWSADRPIAVEPFDHPVGTEILIDMPEAWETRGFDRVVENAALHYPLPVWRQGRELRRLDWLAGASHVESWETGRIGVYRDASSVSGEPTVNFHGLTLKCALPSSAEIGGPTWTVRYDVGRVSPLQLVLPARKEVVQNAAQEALRTACRAALFRAIAAEPSHRLAHKDWLRAADLGIPLAEASPWLSGWAPPVADYHDENYAGVLRDMPMIIVDRFEADTAQSAARALGDGEALGGRLAEAEPRFAGYSWYDGLPHIVDLRFVVRDGETLYSHDEASPLEDAPAGRVDEILLAPVFADNRTVQPLPADLLVIKDPYGCDDLTDTTVVMTRDAKIDVADLADLLERAVFSPSDDSGADSWETQRDDFRDQARRVAADLLLSEDEAHLLQIKDMLRKAWWLIPEGRSIAVTMGRDDIALAFVPAPPVVETG
jgi:hypothetical protein